MIVLDNLDEKIYPSIGHSSPAKYVLETFGGLNCTDTDKLVYENFSSCWLGRVPELDKVKYPATFSYVEDEKNKDTLKMQEEMKNVEIYIPKGQHLFHGGVFPKNPKIGDQIITISMFSTTIDSYTASMHAIQEEPKNLWVIKLNEDTRALPLSIDGMEESEVLVFSPLNLEIVGIEKIFKENNFGNKIEMDVIFLETIKEKLTALN